MKSVTGMHYLPFTDDERFLLYKRLLDNNQTSNKKTEMEANIIYFSTISVFSL